MIKILIGILIGFILEKFLDVIKIWLKGYLRRKRLELDIREKITDMHNDVLLDREI